MGIVQACKNIQVWWSCAFAPQHSWEPLPEIRTLRAVMLPKYAHHADILHTTKTSRRQERESRPQSHLPTVSYCPFSRLENLLALASAFAYLLTKTLALLPFHLTCPSILSSVVCSQYKERSFLESASAFSPIDYHLPKSWLSLWNTNKWKLQKQTWNALFLLLQCK